MQSGNSNQPLPQAATGIAEGFQPLYAARSWKRLVNFLIDYACSVVLSYLFVFFLGILLAIFIICLGGRPQLARIPNPVLQAIGMTGWIAAFLLYYGVQEYFWGRTLGKFLTRTMVISADGDRPTLGQVVGRTFSRLIPFEPFSYLFGGSYPIGWHDSLSKTRVVDKPRPPIPNP